MNRLLIVAALILCAGLAHAQGSKDEPGWSVTVISVAAACRADPEKVEQAAGYVAQWAVRNLKDPDRLTKDKVLSSVNESDDIKAILKQKGAFIYPCDRWRQMLDTFIASKGSVMGGVQPESAKSPPPQSTAVEGWNNREGKCTFFFDPVSPPIQRITLDLDTVDGAALQLTLTISADGLSVLGKKQKNNCRFYGDMEGSIMVGTQRINSTLGGSTACNPNAAGIGADTQFLDFSVKGADVVEKSLKTILSSGALSFVVQNGPKAGQSITVPLKGLKDVIKGITICPRSVVRAVTD
jgi:hypothetical protein